MVDAPVIIAGGGPIGMTLALELASHGVRSIVLERNATTTRHPKMDLTNGRSMELYRRMGLVDRLRQAGVPDDHCFDIVWATRGPNVGRELHRFRYPSPAEVRAIARQRNDGTYTREPPMRVSQIVIEPVLKAAIDENPLTEARFGWTVEGFEQDRDGVTVLAETCGAQKRLRCDYLVGCDGGGSRVRAGLGIALEGEFDVGRAFTIHFHSDRRDVLQPQGPWWHWQTLQGSLVAQDDVDTWTLHTFLPEGVDASALDAAAVVQDWAGCDFDFEVLVANPWSPHLVVGVELRGGPRLLGRRLGPSGDPDRRLRHEQRSRRRRRPRVEARSRHQRMGRKSAVGILRSRAPADRAPESTGVATTHGGTSADCRDPSFRSRRREPRPYRNRRGAGCVGQRRERVLGHRARLSLPKLTDHLP